MYGGCWGGGQLGGLGLDGCLSTAHFGGRFLLGPGPAPPPLLCQAHRVRAGVGGGAGGPVSPLNPALTGHSLSLQVALIFVSCFIFSSI